MYLKPNVSDDENGKLSYFLRLVTYNWPDRVFDTCTETTQPTSSRWKIRVTWSVALLILADCWPVLNCQAATLQLFSNPFHFHDIPTNNIYKQNVRYTLHALVLCPRRQGLFSCHRLICYTHWRFARKDQRREEQPSSRGRCLKPRSKEGTLYHGL